MGNICTPPHLTRKNGGLVTNFPSTTKIIHYDGRLEELKVSIKASHILSQNPSSFLCSLESMNVDSHAPHVPIDQELKLGKIYFLIPISKSHVQLSLQDLCSLAIKASSALEKDTTNSLKILRFTKSGRCWTGLEVAGIMNSQAGRSSRRIEFYD